jgi:hypothetical protein
MSTLQTLYQVVAHLKNTVEGLQKDFYNFKSFGYKGTFSTESPSNTYLLNASVHKVDCITKVIVYNQIGDEVDVVYKVMPDNSLLLLSNLPMVNFTLLIK